METIVIMAQALVKASKMEMMRLDIQYNDIKDVLIGYLTLQSGSIIYDYVISENGTVSQGQNKGEKL